MSREADIVRASQARNLLADDAFAAAVASAKQKQVSLWAAADTPQTREGAWQRYHAIEDVVAQLQTLVGRGEMAQHELDREATRVALGRG